MEKFIPFEIAKKLEEKGFEIKQGTNYLYYNGKLVRMNDYLNISPYEYAPTIDEVLKWLREEKEIMVFPVYSTNTSKWCCSIVNADSLDTYKLSLSDSYEQANLEGIEYVLNNLI